MSLSGVKYDTCYKNYQQSVNKSIFDYVTDTTAFKNKNECLNDTPPFLAYISAGIQSQNVDVESELFGLNYAGSKCNETRYQGVPDLANGMSKTIYPQSPNNRTLCTADNRIIRNGYLMNSNK
jgi:hypothetical protein